MEFSAESYSNPGEEEPREVNVLKMRMKHAQDVIDGKLISGDTVYFDLVEALKAAEETSVNIDAFKSEIDNLLERIPAATITNYINEVEKFIGKGDLTSAKMWQAALENNFAYWEKNGLFGLKGVPELFRQSRELYERIQQAHHTS
jgi:hypothetical protein